MSDIEQRTEEWFAARLGKVTASRVADVIAKTKTGYAATRENYIAQLVLERITKTKAEGFTSSAMQWGVDQEAAAKERFESVNGLIVTDTPYIDHPRIPFLGCSPDGFVSDGSLIEVKCPKTKTHMKYIANQEVPAEYKPQMTLQAAVTGKAVWFVSYDPRMGEGKDLFIKKFKPTPEEIKVVEDAAEQFLAECDALFDFYNNKAVYFDKD